MYGDKTLHINIGILTFFKILTSENIKIKKRKSNAEGDFYVPNSNLSLIIEKLIKTEIITLYKKESNSEWVWDS